MHAWLAAVRSYERLLSGDFDSAHQWARRAVEVGTGSDPAAVAIGRMAEARSLILQGDVTHLLRVPAGSSIPQSLQPTKIKVDGINLT